MRGWVERIEGGLLVVGRRFKSPGSRYDGLEASQEPGDHGLIELRRGAWISRRRYFRRDGRLIGDLYNVQTPATFGRAEVAYVDLEIDVAYLPHRRPSVVVQDVPDLEAATAAGHIPAEIAAVARRLADDLAERLPTGDARSFDGWAVEPDPASLAALAVPVFLDAPGRDGT